MSDRFTQAYAELPGKNPYLCESCGTTFGHPPIMHLPGDIGRHDQQEFTKRSDTLFDDDIIPFGD